MKSYPKGNVFRWFFDFESRRFLCKRNLLIGILLYILSLGFLQVGIGDFFSQLDRKVKFQDIERKKVSLFVNYRQYGTYGFRTIFQPSPFSIFFHDSCVIPDMNAWVDSGERLRIYLPLKGRNIFELKKSGFTDFSGIVLFFGSLMALLYGLESYSSKEYLKFLSSMAGYRKVFLYIFLSRLLLLFLFMVVLIFLGLVVIALNGLIVPIGWYFFVFVLGILFIPFFFFALGTAFNRVRSKDVRSAAGLCLWFFLVFVMPAAVNSFIARKANNIKPIYQLELEKLKIVMDFEQYAIKKVGPFNAGTKVKDDRRKIMLNYFENEFTKIQSIEYRMRNQMERNLLTLHGISLFFPTNFYLNANNELSSRGYENFVDYYMYMQRVKNDFVRYILDKVYSLNFSDVKTFRAGSQNVFHARSRLPGYFAWGSILNLFYILVLIQISYNGFKRSMFELPDNQNGEASSTNMQFKKGDFKVFCVDGELFNSLMYSLLSGQNRLLKKKELIGTVNIDGIDIVSKTCKSGFFYLCSMEHIPRDIKVGNFFNFLSHILKVQKKELLEICEAFNIDSISGRTFKQLKKSQLGGVLLALLQMKKTGTFLINDIVRGMTAEFAVRVTELLNKFKDEGALVIFLTTDDILYLKSKTNGRQFYESGSWFKVVNTYKDL